jgi:hypothetical protein
MGRVVYYGCAAYHRRRRTICGNSLTVPMENADRAVLSSIESDLLHPRTLILGLQRAVERITRPQVEETDTAAELRALEQEIARLTDAIAAGGGSIPALVGAMQAREMRRRELMARRTEHRRVLEIDPHTVRVELEERLADWRTLLHERATHGRHLLKQLIVGRLDLTPDLEGRCYDFMGAGTLMPVIAGVVPQSVASLMPASWNHIVEWLGLLDGLRRAS